MVKLTGNSEFLRSTDITGEVLAVVAGEGEYKDTKYGRKLNMPITINGEKKTWTLNATSQGKIGDVYGDDTVDWVGKAIKLTVVKMMVNKEMKDVILGEASNLTPVDVAPPAIISVEDVDKSSGWPE